MIIPSWGFTVFNHLGLFDMMSSSKVFGAQKHSHITISPSRDVHLRKIWKEQRQGSNEEEEGEGEERKKTREKEKGT